MSTAFKGLKTPREILQYNLMRGVTDFSNLEQYDLYEKGYPFMMVVKAPDFMLDLAKKDPSGIGVIVNNYIHILENDFRGIDNIESITGETNGEITNGIRSIQLINKVTKGTSSTQFTARYYERSGSIITKANELYLTGIKDPDTQVKHYHGLIDDYVFRGIETLSGKDPGPHRECWAFLYFVTDNTMTKIERAFLIAAVQPNTANFADLYAGDKGAIEFPELTLNFNGFFINNDMVYQKAQKALLSMRNPNNLTGSRIIVDSNNFAYTGINDIKVDTEGTDTDWYSPEGKVTSNGNLTMASNKYVSGSVDATTEGAYTESVKSLKNNGNGGEHFINNVDNA